MKPWHRRSLHDRRSRTFITRRLERYAVFVACGWSAASVMRGQERGCNEANAQSERRRQYCSEEASDAATALRSALRLHRSLGILPLVVHSDGDGGQQQQHVHSQTPIHLELTLEARQRCQAVQATPQYQIHTSPLGTSHTLLGLWHLPRPRGKAWLHLLVVQIVPRSNIHDLLEIPHIVSLRVHVLPTAIPPGVGVRGRV